MAKLKPRSWTFLEEAFEMGEGYVLKLTNRQFANLMGEFDIDIDDNLYSQNGTSKAKRLSAFLRMAPDLTAASVPARLRSSPAARFRIPAQMLI